MQKCKDRDHSEGHRWLPYEIPSISHDINSKPIYRSCKKPNGDIIWSILLVGKNVDVALLFILRVEKIRTEIQMEEVFYSKVPVTEDIINTY